jgi:hypothetical protein
MRVLIGTQNALDGVPDKKCWSGCRHRNPQLHSESGRDPG